MSEHEQLKGTYYTKHGRPVVVTPLYIAGKDVYDLDYLDAGGFVYINRHALTRQVVTDIKTLEGWQKGGVSR